MDFWDDLSKKVGEAATATAKGAEKLTDMAKIKYYLTIKQGKLDKIFESIGSLRYEEYKNSVDNSEVIEKLLADADVLNDEIKELRENMAKLRNSKICSVCNARLAKDMTYCPNCGAKQDQEQ